MEYKIHNLADVQSVNIGHGTFIWQFCVILKKAIIGNNCNINCGVLIENDVVIGDNVTIKSGVQIWDGVRLEDNVFVGPNATFTNDLVPRSKSKNWTLKQTIVKKGATIGANATIVADIIIGEFAFIGAGSVLTKSVAPHTVWYGNPATQKGYITEEADVLDMNLINHQTKERYKLVNHKPIKIK
ncbi:acyltransferase [Pedobacter aquatilis]|uniref:acyltransferase n=1 Tax=Pedobacter aquatilis TaxID=351343 RepID=UPI0025B2B580|nr:acyltransferase [Pedobacter aquatilis]MDN3587288.1 acyltransferase [Pedobacter aquatilis]